MPRKKKVELTIEERIAAVEAELEALRDENASLISTKEKLEDPDYVQTYARGEYMFSNLLKPE